ncbi:MAG: NADH-quinone oxidoreductase subunit NuoF [bacterium]
MGELKIITKNFDVPDQHKIGVYMKGGGYEVARKVFDELKPDEVIEEVKKAGVRGRGGAGFPAGMKWGFIPKESKKPKYLCCNADEGEPGTFKDRYILLRDPHLMLEGILITCYAIGIHSAYIYIRGEYVKEADILQAAIDDAYEKGFFGKNIFGKGFDLEVVVHRGAGAYICGEETGLIESLEGKRGEPRLKPPFPAIVGVFQGPTVVNNVETLANIPRIMEKGGEWYASIGPERNTGTRLFAVSGHVNRPGIYELTLDVTARELVYDYCGGIRGGRKLKALIPGGSSSPCLRESQLDVQMSFDALMKAGTMGGSGAVIVLDETVSIPHFALRTIRFYKHESCGQCTPCREGVPWLEKILARIVRGEGMKGDVDLALEICDNIMGKTLCPLGDAAAMPIRGFLKQFRTEFEELIKKGKPAAEAATRAE